MKKPLKPKLTIQVASGSVKDEMPHPVQILSAYICDEHVHQLILMHGNYLRPTFEKVVSTFMFSREISCFYFLTNGIPMQ